MSDDEPDAPEAATSRDDDGSPTEEARRVLQDYANQLRAMLDKLRRKLN